MFFGFDEDQLAFQTTVRDLLDKECPPEVVRAAWDAAPGQLDRTVWDHLAEVGVLSTLIPEDAGGLGLDERWQVLVLEETGRAALPHPVVDTATVAAPLLAGIDAVIQAGGIVASDLGGPNVACAADADRFLLRRGNALYLVEPGAVTLSALETVDRGRRAARVEWSPGDGSLVIDDPEALALAFDRGAFGTAAQLIGLGQRMLDMTVAYVTEREQFGKPVGSFQAIKHHLADALKELSFARPAVHRAAHSLATGAETRRRDVSMAKAMASDAASFVGRQALQCHGAIGYTVEADLHLYLKRTWALAAAWGTAAWHRDRVGQALGV
jgi:alkylation response protein AidB-like acyl-CoA dehydrogenase